MKRGKFIVVDGPDNSGKSSVVRELRKLLYTQGFKVQEMADLGSPGDIYTIREILMNNHAVLSPVGRMMLVEASRALLIAEVNKLLDLGVHVICDRYTLTTTVYQHAVDGIDLDFINDLHDKLCKDLPVDLGLRLDVSLDVAASRDIEDNPFEPATMEARKVIHDAYAEHGGDYVAINADLPIQQVVGAAVKAINEKLELTIP